MRAFYRLTLGSVWTCLQAPEMPANRKFLTFTSQARPTLDN
jgi:hypothetical protein